jgi:carboxylesterase
MQGNWFTGDEHRSFAWTTGERGALLIHGFMGSPAELRPLADLLAQHDFSSYGPLLPGFGERLDTLDQVGREQWVGEPGQLWEELHRSGKGQLIVGFSMGGAIAIHLARHLPPERLILLAPLWKVLGGDWRLNLLPVLKHAVKRVKPFAGADLDDVELREFFADAMPELDLDNPDHRDVVRNEIELSTATIDELRRLASEAGDLAPHLDVPTLVIQGNKDTSVRLEDTRALVDRMTPQTRYVEVNAGHLLVSDQGEAWPKVEELVTNFVNGEDV